MLKKMSIKKIIISLSALFTLFLVYLIPAPDTKELEPVVEEIEYKEEGVETSVIYLLDSYSDLGRTEVVTSTNSSIENKCKELIQVLIHGGIGEDKIPSGFRSILPSDTKVNTLSFHEGHFLFAKNRWSFFCSILKSKYLYSY